jgi:hypothetical protein
MKRTRDNANINILNKRPKQKSLSNQFLVYREGYEYDNNRLEIDKETGEYKYSV